MENKKFNTFITKVLVIISMKIYPFIIVSRGKNLAPLSFYHIKQNHNKRQTKRPLMMISKEKIVCQT